MHWRWLRCGYTPQRCSFKHPTTQEHEAWLNFAPTIEPIFYADIAASVNTQLHVVEDNFSRASSVIQRKRDVYELLRVLLPDTSAGSEAAHHANFALGSPRVLARFVRVGPTRRAYT